MDETGNLANDIIDKADELKSYLASLLQLPAESVQCATMAAGVLAGLSDGLGLPTSYTEQVILASTPIFGSGILGGLRCKNGAEPLNLNPDIYHDCILTGAACSAGFSSFQYLVFYGCSYLIGCIAKHYSSTV